MSGRTLPLAVAALMGIAALGDIATSPSLAATQKSEAEIEEIVRNYLLENPEVIFESVQRYREKQEALEAAAAAETARGYLPELRSNPAGQVVPAPSGDAEIVVVEFFDYNCSACRFAADFVFELQEDDPNIELVFQELPVTNRLSRGPSLLALSVADTDGYVGFHRAMMKHDSLIDQDVAASIAKDLGLPQAAIRSAMQEGDFQASLHERLDASMDLADELGIGATPAFIVASADGEYVRVFEGFYGPNVMEMIAEAKNASRK
ncbi:thioredoxin domain-containing protein [Parvularcula marina]|uniref:DsbA family protein n=1 Tax=Parvularcula marina TaxID=2292771 RepID=UPI0035128A06